MSTDHDPTRAPTQASTQAPTPANETETNPLPDSPDALMQAATARIAGLEAELTDMRDRWMRAEAETQNIRARGQREVAEARQFAVQKFASDVAEVAETLRRGLAAIPAATADEPPLVARLREGFEGTERSFVAALERHGIVSEDPTGAMFDPNKHQAMAEQESAEHPPGTVVQAWSQAWLLNGRLLRPAMVVVAKAPIAEVGVAGVVGPKLDTTA
jgi:molecular chaperone GrpE